jgi:predicted site-specific integrase-resolvase
MIPALIGSSRARRNLTGIPSRDEPSQLRKRLLMTKAKVPDLAALPIRAAQYVRMSTEHQQYSIDNQSEAISLYARQHHMQIVKTYADVGKSGLTMGNRPGLKQLISDVQGDAIGYSTILVYDVS